MPRATLRSNPDDTALRALEPDPWHLGTAQLDLYEQPARYVGGWLCRPDRRRPGASA